MVRDVIIHHGFACTVLSVSESPSGWDIEIRTRSGGLRSFSVFHDRPTATRIAIHRHLEAEA
jgi:hypothetical protein